MKIVSTTLAGPNAEDDGIAYALESVAPFVDAHVVIDTTGLTYNPLASLPGNIDWYFWEWRNDFGMARNVALNFARECGADWAITVDCDERIEPHGEDVRKVIEELDSVGATGLLSLDEGETYAKPRAIKVTATPPVRWTGRAHESIILNSPQHLQTFPLLRFSEATKSPEDLQQKFLRDSVLLRDDIKDNPQSTRAWYYLGVSLHGIGDLDEAIKAYKTCAMLNGWYEESAWACYKAASLLVQLKRYDEALECCAAGMRRDAGMAEIPALASLITSDPEQARCYAEIARVHGPESKAFARRLGFRDGPFVTRTVAHVLTSGV
jgi:tetratricopeptide (TPR) repeat protein